VTGATGQIGGAPVMRLALGIDQLRPSAAL
jgi:hypothetical protein